MIIQSGSLAQQLGGRLDGPMDLPIRGLGTLETAGPQDVSFVGEAKYASGWVTSQARCILVSEGIVLPPRTGTAVIWVKNADLAMARALEIFAPPDPSFAVGIHFSAVVDPSAVIAADACIGPHCYVGPRAKIGAKTVLHPGVTLLDDAMIGDGCVIHSRCVIEARCQIGDGCILHAGCVIGADGFGYRPSDDGKRLVKIPHIGSVSIGRQVELGANCTIDRGKFGATTLGDGCKFDNLVHVGHNCRIGRGVLIAATTVLGGSVEIGDGAMISGQCGIRDHIKIGRGARLAGGTMVLEDVAPGESMLGYPAMPVRDFFKLQVLLRRLPEFMRRQQSASADKTT